MNLTNLEIAILIILIFFWIITIIYFRYLLKKQNLTFSQFVREYFLDFLEKYTPKNYIKIEGKSPNSVEDDFTASNLAYNYIKENDENPNDFVLYWDYKSGGYKFCNIQT